MRQAYLESLAKVRDQKVDIFLGNHCENNQTLERHRRMQEDQDHDNPFIDSEQWAGYLDKMRDSLLLFMSDPNNS